VACGQTTSPTTARWNFGALVAAAWRKPLLLDVQGGDPWPGVVSGRIPVSTRTRAATALRRPSPSAVLLHRRWYGSSTRRVARVGVAV
jgi:hypothetical protein